MAILKHYHETKKKAHGYTKNYYETIKKAHGYTKTLLCNNEEGSWLY